ncbi:GNAT family N-acetyltransferase [Polymorphospora sp. NPDC050346]|uniref:GNAT family N-acetyltransferase n=1 Tax=Polymorphospora sp. NPDC050346 TaxID=3155780 RepID=UPI0034001A2F
MTATDLRMRGYRDADLPRLTDTFAGWIAQAGSCGYDHVGEVPHRIYENLRGRPIGELVQLWERDGEIVGLAVNGRFGNAFDVFTAPGQRGGGAELTMLRSAADTTAGQTDEGAVLTDVFDCDTTRIELLERLGFARFRTWDHVNERDLREAVEESRLPDGFAVRPARLVDADQLAAVRNHSFGTSWIGDLYRSAVMTKPGYDPAHEIVVEAPDGRIAAFAVCWLDRRNRIGHFEPVGTHRDFQRRGLAGAAMRHAMRWMAGLGMTRVSVNHDAENVAARRLYASLGFHKRHETYGYRRAIDTVRPARSR